LMLTLAATGCAADAASEVAPDDFNARICTRVWACAQACPSCPVAPDYGTDLASCRAKLAAYDAGYEALADCGITGDGERLEDCIERFERDMCPNPITFGCPGVLRYDYTAMLSADSCYCARLAASSRNDGPCGYRPICGPDTCGEGGIECVGDLPECSSSADRFAMADAATLGDEEVCKAYMEPFCDNPEPSAAGCWPGLLACQSDTDCLGFDEACNTALAQPLCQTLGCGAPGSSCSRDALCASQRCESELCW